MVQRLNRGDSCMRWFFTLLLSLVVVNASASVYVHDPGDTLLAPAYAADGAVIVIDTDAVLPTKRAAAVQHDNFLTNEATFPAADRSPGAWFVLERQAVAADATHSKSYYITSDAGWVTMIREHERCCSWTLSI